MKKKEKIFRNFLEDSLIKQKYGINEENLIEIKLFEESREQLVEVIRLAVVNFESDLSVHQIRKVINQYFRKS